MTTTIIRCHSLLIALIPALLFLSACDEELGYDREEDEFRGGEPEPWGVVQVCGNVDLEHWIDNSFTTVAAYEGSCDGELDLANAADHALTDANGDYCLELVEATYCLHAEARDGRFLAAVAGEVEVIEGEALPSTMLALGDVTDDGWITISDVTVISGRYDCAGPSVFPYADLDGDGVICDGDITIATDNFNLHEPTDW